MRETTTIAKRRIGAALITAFMLLMGCGMAYLGWICIPLYFPHWTVLHSPWIDPVIRACAVGDVGNEHVGMSRLAQFGTDAVPIILPYVKHPDPKLRRIAAAALGNIHDARGIDPLLDLLDDPDRTVRSTAMRSANRLGPSPQQRERMQQMQSR